jgi:hypothetical protein
VDSAAGHCGGEGLSIQQGTDPVGRAGRGWHSLVHHAMADNDTAVIRAGCKQWVSGVEGHSPQGLLVVPRGGLHLLWAQGWREEPC